MVGALGAGIVSVMYRRKVWVGNKEAGCELPDISRSLVIL